MSGGHPPLRWSGRAYLRFLAAVAAALAVLAGVGVVLPGARAEGSLTALLAALGVTGAASVVAGIVITFTGGPPTATFVRAILAMLARLLLVAGLGVVCVLVLGVAKGPFLIWLVVAYLVLLAIDTGFSVRGAKKPAESL